MDHQRLQDLHHQRRFSATWSIVAARTSPEKKAKGISLFGVDTTLPGFSVGRVLDKVGQDESDTAELSFENVRVSNADLIGPLDTGFISMMQFLPQERLGSAVTNLAHAAADP
ncbi:MAG: acyl-CoA dehydrogenase family protein [Nocardioides sp.]